MGYKLRCDLSKTVVYDLCKQYLPEEYQIPFLWKCEFKKSRGTYWFSYVEPGMDSYFDREYEFSFGSFSGSCYVQLTHYIYVNGRRVAKQLSFNRVPFDVLFSAGFFREVA